MTNIEESNLSRVRDGRQSEPFEYLNRFLGMFRPFAYATEDDSWGELEKILCIVHRRISEAAIREIKEEMVSSDNLADIEALLNTLEKYQQSRDKYEHLY